MNEKKLGWWVISGEMLGEMLYRASQGESPELLYIELIANSETERYGEGGDDDR